MAVTVYTLDVFTKQGSGGNRAGVVLDADGFSDQQMRGIAHSVGFSEIAFVQQSNQAAYRVRFFTPKAEVDLCGHATLAVFALLKKRGLIHNGICSQETKAGVLNIDVNNDFIYMNQARPRYYDWLDPAEIAASLSITPDDCLPNLTPQIVSTGLKDIMMPVKNLHALHSLQPDFHKIMAVSQKYDVVGIHAFCLDAKHTGTIYCRNFAPRYGIDEEAATGTSNGALACYLYRYGIIPQAEDHVVLTCEQGELMGKPSEILVRLKLKNTEITEVLVGGWTMERDPICLPDI